MQKYQSQIVIGALLLFALIIAYQSFFAEYDSAFLFPKIISTVLIFMTLIGLALSFKEDAIKLDLPIMKPIFIGLAMMVFLVYFALKTFGFYSACYVFLIIMLSVYDGKSHQDMKAWLRRFLVSSGFMVVIYLLFSLLLKVQTPRGILL
ncbi:MAG: tripartite tricarboxylate transporter TctB family protein [Alphaproteobacteria bacterium]|nr:tripartite tricarboxylate transporter TctB family protein [Alphaproteobacteria bacterium]